MYANTNLYTNSHIIAELAEPKIDIMSSDPFLMIMYLVGSRNETSHIRAHQGMEWEVTTILHIIIKFLPQHILYNLSIS